MKTLVFATPWVLVGCHFLALSASYGVTRVRPANIWEHPIPVKVAVDRNGAVAYVGGELSFPSADNSPEIRSHGQEIIGTITSNRAEEFRDFKGVATDWPALRFLRLVELRSAESKNRLALKIDDHTWVVAKLKQWEIDLQNLSPAKKKLPIALTFEYETLLAHRHTHPETITLTVPDAAHRVLPLESHFSKKVEIISLPFGNTTVPFAVLGKNGEGFVAVPLQFLNSAGERAGSGEVTVSFPAYRFPISLLQRDEIYDPESLIPESALREWFEPYFRKELNWPSTSSFVPMTVSERRALNVKTARFQANFFGLIPISDCDARTAEFAK